MRSRLRIFSILLLPVGVLGFTSCSLINRPLGGNVESQSLEQKTESSESPASKKSQATDDAKTAVSPPPSGLEMRLGDDILALPNDQQLQSSPSNTAREKDASIIVRPPSE